MKQPLLIFLIALLCLFLFSQCKKQRCPDGFVSVDNTCICPSDKFEGNGRCRNLKPNEYYAIAGQDCLCQDTFFMEILEKLHHPNRIRVRFDLGWATEEETIAYIETPGGDSLTTEEYSVSFPVFNCTKDRIAYAQVFGKFFDNDTKIRITLRYLLYPRFEEEIGRCQFVFRQ